MFNLKGAASKQFNFPPWLLENDNLIDCNCNLEEIAVTRNVKGPRLLSTFLRYNKNNFYSFYGLIDMFIYCDLSSYTVTNFVVNSNCIIQIHQFMLQVSIIQDCQVSFSILQLVNISLFHYISYLYHSGLCLLSFFQL